MKNKINLVKNWYRYSDHKIIPEPLNKNLNDHKLTAKKQIYIDSIAMS